jgi:hypothetical protein
MIPVLVVPTTLYRAPLGPDDDDNHTRHDAVSYLWHAAAITWCATRRRLTIKNASSQKC